MIESGPDTRAMGPIERPMSLVLAYAAARPWFLGPFSNRDQVYNLERDWFGKIRKMQFRDSRMNTVECRTFYHQYLKTYWVLLFYDGL